MGEPKKRVYFDQGFRYARYEGAVDGVKGMREGCNKEESLEIAENENS